MSTQNRLGGSLNAFVIIMMAIIIAIAINVLGGTVSTRVDLTEYGTNSLSDFSKEISKELDELEVRVFISPDLPERKADPNTGREVVLREVVQRFKDKLEEYQANSDGQMKVTYVQNSDEDGTVVEQAKRAGVAPFGDKEASVSGGRIEFKEYVLGAVFTFENVTEAFPLALSPDFFEFEISRIMARLKEKAEHSVLMDDVLAAGDAIQSAVDSCQKLLDAAEPEDDGKQDALAVLSGEASQQRLAAYQKVLPELKPTCAKIDESLAAADKVAEGRDKSRAFETVRLVGDAYSKLFKQLVEALGSEEVQVQNQGLAVAQQLGQYASALDGEHQSLKDSPGRRRIGVVCNAQTFCPFATNKPLVPESLQPMLAQNAFAKQIVPALEQMNQQISMTLAQIDASVFRQNHFDTVRVDLDAKMPPDLTGLVVIGARSEFSEYQLYQLDQFVMRGGSLVVFLNNWDAGIANYSPQMRQDQPQRMDVTALTANASNIGDLLGHFGIRPNADLVMEPKEHGDIELIQLRQVRGVTFQGQRPFPYPMLPRFKDLDKTNPLVRAVGAVTLPFTSSLTLGAGATPLVTSSKEALALDAPTVEELEAYLKEHMERYQTGEKPPALADIQAQVQTDWLAEYLAPYLEPAAQLKRAAQGGEGAGAKVVAAVSQGQMTSYFKGKEAPTKPQDSDKAEDDDGKKEGADKDVAADAQRADSGNGRVLVVGSNLGLETLSTDVIFKGFTPTSLMDQNSSIEIFDKFPRWRANLQNWDLRIRQLLPTIRENIRFLHNTLDWSVQKEGLLEIRSKVFASRELEQLDDGEQNGLRWAAVLLAPFLVLLLGWLNWLLQRRRRRNLKV